MKKFLLFALAVLLLGTSQAIAAKGPHYNIKVKINGLKDTMVYLANYMGDNTYLVDSGRMNNKGLVVFSRDTVLPCGIYMIAVNRMKLFEFVVFENDFSLETDTVNYLSSMKIKNSPQNDMFFEFQKYTYNLGVEEDQMKTNAQKWANDPANADTVAKINERLKKIPQEVFNYRTEFMKKYPDAVLTQIFNALREPDVPAPPKDENGNIDSMWQYDYYRDHFWDHVDFSSGCVLRSPVYHNKLMRFMEQVSYQHPDSLYERAVNVIEKTKANKEMFRYTLIQLVNKYEKSPYVCMDGIPVRLALKYYNYKDCFWLDSTEIYRTRSNAESYLPTLCYLYAPKLEMYDSTLQRKVNAIVEADTNEQTRGEKLGVLLAKSKTTNLYDVKANYTVLVFWDPDCGHCKKEMPIIKSFYDTVKARGVEVYAVGVEQDMNKWIEYIRENQFKWINVTDVWNITQFRKYYNLNSTPQIFLLDKDKKIIAKRLTAEQLKEILYQELGLPYTAPQRKRVMSIVNHIIN